LGFCFPPYFTRGASCAMLNIDWTPLCLYSYQDIIYVVDDADNVTRCCRVMPYTFPANNVR